MSSYPYFFSYSRQNTAFVTKLSADLQASDFPVWFDQLHIAPGARWDDSIQNALQASKGMLVVLSKASVQSQNVMDEISYAIDLGKHIVPLMIERCDVPFRLARFQYIDFTGNYEQALHKLQQVMRNSDVTKPGEKEHPYKMQESVRTSPKPLQPVAPLPTAAKPIATKKGLFIATATALLVVVGIVLAKWINHSNPNTTTTPVSTTVFVHGKGGRQDMILRQKGFVTMDLGAERKRASINENGQAFFQNLHVGDSVQLEIDFSEPYKTLYADSMYVIRAGGSIYLPVALQGIDQVKGMVLYKDAPLNGVVVKLVGKNGYLLDTTNQTGDYTFTIPEKMQTKEYEVWFIKEGYKTTSKAAFPETGAPLNIVMKRN